MFWTVLLVAAEFLVLSLISPRKEEMGKLYRAVVSFSFWMKQHIETSFLSDCLGYNPAHMEGNRKGAGNNKIRVVHVVYPFPILEDLSGLISSRYVDSFP